MQFCSGNLPESLIMSTQLETASHKEIIKIFESTKVEDTKKCATFTYIYENQLITVYI